jgi:hypothetical protein
MFPPNLGLSLEVEAEQKIDTWLEMNASCEIGEYLPNVLTIVVESSEYFPRNNRVKSLRPK